MGDPLRRLAEFVIEQFTQYRCVRRGDLLCDRQADICIALAQFVHRGHWYRNNVAVDQRFDRPGIRFAQKNLIQLN